MNITEVPLRWSMTAAAVAAMAALALMAPQAGAQTRGATSMDVGQAARSTASEYWTPERFATARQRLPTLASTPAVGIAAAAAAQARTGASTSASGQRPVAGRPLDEVNLYPSTMRAAAAGGVGATSAAPMAIAPSAYGAFTHSRVTPTSNTREYPYSTVGKLFFTVPGQGNFVCSASVLRRRVVQTAGHCVSTPSTNAANRFFHTNFVFVPGLTDGTGPFGNWTPSRIWVDNRWHFSNGSVPNAGDFGWLVMNDRTISGVSRRIGDVTGNLGYVTGALNGNHATMLGYPCNLDDCNRMQMTSAGFNRDGGTNTAIYPSIMRGGASGGPWIQDFGIAPAGAPASSSGLNKLIGVTSYGPTSTAFQYLGSSRLDWTWLNILRNSVCAGAPAGSC